MIRKLLITMAIILAVIILIVSLSVLPLDRYDYKSQKFYSVMMERLDNLPGVAKSSTTKRFSAGYTKVNLTPQKPTATAGYGNRLGKVYSAVHDSIYVRTIVISNGNQKVALVSVDLLIVPPTVTAVLEKELPSIGFSLDNTYLSAIHTHNSIGNWGGGVTEILYGKYNDTIVHFIADKIKESIYRASQTMKSAEISTLHIPLRSPVRNRLDKKGSVDSLLHVIEIKRSDSTKLIMMSYTAHATCVDVKDFELSRDYPGRLVDQLEASGYDFAMFMAGAVGSHACNAPVSDWGCVDWMADTIVSTFMHKRNELKSIEDSTLLMYRVPLALGEAQVKISKDWRVRPWIFRAAFGEYASCLTLVRMGELVLLGTPCDYSGQLTKPLYAQAKQLGLQVMVTSFNGGYIGYITPLRYYDSDHYETRLMNWYGPGNGEYFQACFGKMMDAAAK